MNYHYVWLVWSSAFLVPWLLLFLAIDQHRRQMWWTSLPMVPFGGKVLVIHVSGKLLKEDYAEFVPEFERLLRQLGTLRLLFNMIGFHGWEASAAWEDLKFSGKQFADIERLTMIGEKKCQQGMADILQAVYASGGALPRSRRRRRGAEVVGRRVTAAATQRRLVCGICRPSDQLGLVLNRRSFGAQLGDAVAACEFKYAKGGRNFMLENRCPDTTIPP